MSETTRVLEDAYADSDVPGEFRRLTERLVEVTAGSAVRVAPGTTRSHRNLGEEPVEIWAVSRRLDHGDSTKVDDFWEASPAARRTREDEEELSPDRARRGCR